MGTTQAIVDILTSTLGLGKRGQSLGPESPLMGDIPEFDSMAVVTVVAAIEDQFDILFEDDEINGSVFETVGSLSDFVDRKLAA
ncbi:MULTISPECIES: phosphopantetheine-binding protein [unclassified Iodidimonas]|jgi:acyl carrier protein|uniref:acyl carrier protein n=1 Tax=unclassified Iodidimonas TaxID=2626145 RepID=UPI002483223E|nr:MULTISPECIES: phosphopantetheine-binding protein [unclassified Iodidimonas]